MNDAAPQAHWIELDGAANARDLAGLPTADGTLVQPRRLLRSDNLQSLSERDVRALVEDYDVRTVADLRTGVEVDAEGPGPLTRVDEVDVRHLSLFPEPARSGADCGADAASDAGAGVDDAATDVVAEVADAADEATPVVLPWQDREVDTRNGRQGASAVYLGYLDQRADSVIEALRLIAESPGATIVNCAAGKDRTGTVVALALSEVGVTREAIVADYSRSAERIEAIVARLLASPTYNADISSRAVDAHAPKAATMQRLLDAIDTEFGGVPAWLRANGWTERDAAALRAKLLAPVG